MSAYVWPTFGGYVSSKFGPRKAPKKGASTYHNGIDIAGCSVILAAKPGKVIAKAYNKYRGNYVIIDHGGGIRTLYQHAASFNVRVGNVVSARQQIGRVGSTGVSRGPHLHFEVQINGVPRNPLSYVNQSCIQYTGSSYAGTGTKASSPSSSSTSSSSGKTSTSSSGAKKTLYNASGTPVAAIPLKTSKEITTVVTKSVGGTGTAQKNLITGLPAQLSYGVEILIQNDKIYLPIVKSGIKLERSRKGSPSKLVFTVLKDGVLNIQEGNPVTMRFNGNPVFAGFIFQKKRASAVEIEVTCYDQMRYLKNKDTFSYTNKTYAEVVKMVADDYRLICGDLVDTKYKIASRIEEGTLLDALQNASDLTVVNTGILYVLYDDFGKLTLKSLQDMMLDVVVDEETANGYEYSSTIDKDTYNKIKLAVDNDTTGEREVYVLNEPENQAKWGQLQYYENLDAGTTKTILEERAKVLMNYYNKKHRTLRIKGVFGDIRVRGGSLVVVKMGLGDMNVKNYMCVESVEHNFDHGYHTMDLTLSGIKGEFVS